MYTNMIQLNLLFVRVIKFIFGKQFFISRVNELITYVTLNYNTNFIWKYQFTRTWYFSYQLDSYTVTQNFKVLNTVTTATTTFINLNKQVNFYTIN